MTKRSVAKPKLRTAIISVSDKRGIARFARELSRMGIEILSTGGTAALLEKEGIPVTSISDYTGFPEMMDGRVKTLHPKIHAGILAVRKDRKHMEQLKKFRIKPIDIVIVNLYPFQKVVNKKKVSFREAIENIDIGGPTMLRAAAKNFENVVVVVDKQDYDVVLSELKETGDVSPETRRMLADKVFAHLSKYDASIAHFLEGRKEIFPQRMTLHFEKVQDLRYGENPHQLGAFYRDEEIFEPSIATAKQLHGKQLSFNNIYDANNALEIVKEFREPTAAIIKHANPCGVAIGKNIADAYRRAHEADPISAFGSIVALNRRCDEKTALLMKPFFIEVVICPSFTEGAKKILMKKKNIRLLEVGPLKKTDKGLNLKKVVGGLLVQTRGCPRVSERNLKCVTRKKPTQKQIEDMLFAWKVNKHVKSNSIVFAKNLATVGIGAGQMSRVDAVRIAAEKAGKKAAGSVMASDAFFPFPDGIEVAAEAGVKAVIQPGGSIRDAEVIEAADRLGMTMVFTGVRFFNH
ncbi:bifunctional phosphoribosylaminoimidazolecarboxamide formyltransferase/IMP cyclohydrolase PurH [Candidatus Woesearchaeota archaeon]|nr:MAG: bifunctional phosphoribosylaminoimidazolecarboxamide formyltransferase/IMP cyclohydrolase PurH [Candidatus Woesearchaeota archaeon]